MNKPVSPTSCEVACLLCSVNDPETLFFARDELLNVGALVHCIVQCRRCGFIYLNPRPTEEQISRFYPAEYPNYTTRGIRSFCRTGLNFSRYFRILSYKTSGKILDVGCATGSFLYFMKKRRKWKVCGIEIDKVAADYTKSLGISVFWGPAEKIPLGNGLFDVVTFWDVLEHLFQPREVLRKVKAFLKEDGLLFLSVPNIKSFEFRLFRHRWFALDAPRHFSHFSRETLTRLLSEEGFRIRHISTSLASHYDIFFRSLKYTLRRGERFLEPRAQLLLDRLRNAFVVMVAGGITFLATPLFFISYLRQQGPELFVVAEKLEGQH